MHPIAMDRMKTFRNRLKKVEPVARYPVIPLKN
jgi:hypothetical protein